MISSSRSILMLTAANCKPEMQYPVADMFNIGVLSKP